MKNSLGWLYHLCPDDILGEKLIPLNRQQLLFPSLYQKNSEMYAGREAITRRCIPLLECYWNDVIHLTNVPPREFLSALNEAGKVPNFEQKWLKIPAVVALENPTVVYSCRSTAPDRLTIPASEVTLFSSDKFTSGIVDQRTKEYYRTQIASGQKILLFQGIAHFLLHGEVEFSRCHTISWNEA
ncbi:MAG: hypothetical protein RI953_1339 [Pseudomonadota bacterium]|jgi:hypothetical protein